MDLDSAFDLRLPDVLILDPVELLVYGISAICGALLALTLGVIPALAIIGLFWVYEVLIPGLK